MKNTFYLGGIVIVYRLIKEEILDGGDYKYMTGRSLQIPRSGSVLIVMFTFGTAYFVLITVCNVENSWTSH